MAFVYQVIGFVTVQLTVQIQATNLIARVSKAGLRIIDIVFLSSAQKDGICLSRDVCSLQCFIQLLWDLAPNYAPGPCYGSGPSNWVILWVKHAPGAYRPTSGQICSWSIIIQSWRQFAPGARVHSNNASGAYLILEAICSWSMCAFKYAPGAYLILEAICSWSMCAFRYVPGAYLTFNITPNTVIDSFITFMVVLKYNLGPKSYVAFCLHLVLFCSSLASSYICRL